MLLIGLVGMLWRILTSSANRGTKLQNFFVLVVNKEMSNKRPSEENAPFQKDPKKSHTEFSTSTVLHNYSNISKSKQNSRNTEATRENRIRENKQEISSAVIKTFL